MSTDAKSIETEYTIKKLKTDLDLEKKKVRDLEFELANRQRAQEADKDLLLEG